MSVSNPIVTIPLSLQSKQFVKDGSVVNYVSCVSVVDGMEIHFYAKDSTAKQLVAKYYARESLEQMTAPVK